MSTYDILKVMVYNGDLDKPQNITQVWRSYGMPGLSKISQMFMLDFVFTEEDSHILGGNKMKIAALHSCNRNGIVVWSKEYELNRTEIDLNKAVCELSVNIDLTVPRT